MLGAVDLIEEELEMRVKQLRESEKLLEAQRLAQRTRYDIEMIRELGYCQGIENYSRYRLAGRPVSHLPRYSNTCRTTLYWLLTSRTSRSPK